MNVLVVAEGLDRSETAMLHQLCCEGLNLVLLTVPGVDVSALQQTGIRIARIPLKGRYDVISIRLIRSYLRRGQIDVVHCLRNNRPLTNTLVAALGTQVRIVAYRGTAGHLSRCDPASWLSYLNPRISRIICVSEAVRQYLLGVGVSPTRAVTIYKGHDLAWYDRQQAVDRAALGMPEDAFVVCCAANMRPDKGVAFLIQALHFVHASKMAHLLLVGKVGDSAVEEAAKDPAIRERVHFTGYREDAIRVIAASDAFVMPSIRREGLPRAVIEAMSQGIPSVVTNIGGMPELVEDGVSGLVVPGSDAVALADALSRLIDDSALQARLGEGGRQQIANKFGIEQTVVATRELYQDIIN